MAPDQPYPVLSPVVLKFAILGQEAPKPKAQFIELDAAGSIIDGIGCLFNIKQPSEVNALSVTLIRSHSQRWHPNDEDTTHIREFQIDMILDLAIAGHRSGLSLDQTTPHTEWDGQGLACSVKGEHVRVEVRVGAHV